MVMFWKKLVLGETTLSSILYKLMLSLKNSNQTNFKWVINILVKSIFDDAGMNYIFANQLALFYKVELKQTLCDQFIQKWFSEIENSYRGIFYSTFKKNFCLKK